jgi:hypothetical protein
MRYENSASLCTRARGNRLVRPKRSTGSHNSKGERQLSELSQRWPKKTDTAHPSITVSPENPVYVTTL